MLVTGITLRGKTDNSQSRLSLERHINTMEAHRAILSTRSLVGY